MGRPRLHTPGETREINRVRALAWYRERKKDMVWRMRRAKAAKEYRNRKILAALCLLLILSACSAWSPILGALLNLHSPDNLGVCHTPVGIDVACDMGSEP